MNKTQNPEEFWKKAEEIEALAVEIAKYMEQQEGRIKRLFSQLSTCISSADARMVLMFHIYRIESRGDNKLANALKTLLDKIPNEDNNFFVRYVLPKLRLLYNSIMYYYYHMRGRR